MPAGDIIRLGEPCGGGGLLALALALKRLWMEVGHIIGSACANPPPPVTPSFVSCWTVDRRQAPPG